MSAGFKCIKCGTGTMVKSNMKFTPDHQPYCRNENGCAARVAKLWAKPMEEEEEPKDHVVFLKG
jgi:hypothetical protein